MSAVTAERLAGGSLVSGDLFERLAARVAKEDGHWAEGITLWGEAPETARTAVAVSVLGIWEFLQRDQPLPHREQLTNAARSWARHRVEGYRAASAASSER